jgi:hypothetical protein
MAINGQGDHDAGVLATHGRLVRGTYYYSRILRWWVAHAMAVHALTPRAAAPAASSSDHPSPASMSTLKEFSNAQRRTQTGSTPETL